MPYGVCRRTKLKKQMALLNCICIILRCIPFTGFLIFIFFDYKLALYPCTVNLEPASIHQLVRSAEMVRFGEVYLLCSKPLWRDLVDSRLLWTFCNGAHATASFAIVVISINVYSVYTLAIRTPTPRNSVERMRLDNIHTLCKVMLSVVLSDTYRPRLLLGRCL